MNIEIGNKKIDFVYQGDDLIYPNYASPENIAFHYDFLGMKNSDVTKGVARDLSGNGNHGELSGFGYLAGSGYENGGLQADGVDDSINSVNDISLNNANLTIETTFFHNKKTGYIYSFGDTNGSRFSIRKTLGNEYIVFYNDGTSSNIPFIFPLDKIIRLTVTYNGVDRKIYLNGVLKYTTSLIENINETLPYSLFGVKNWFNNVRVYPYSGTIYNQLIYNKALTPEEIAQNYAIEKKRFNIID